MTIDNVSYADLALASSQCRNMLKTKSLVSRRKAENSQRTVTPKSECYKIGVCMNDEVVLTERRPLPFTANVGEFKCVVSQ
jgi:hypothetical protein